MNFLEIADVEEANKVDLSIFRLERFSDTKGCYIFVRRRGQ